MKRKKMRLLFRLVCIVFVTSVMLVGAVSCNKTPEIPTDETKEKNHEDPHRAELILVEGHLHGKYAFHQDPEVEGVKHLKKIQKMIFELSEKGWGISDKGVSKFCVRSTSPEFKGQQVYGLWINYYNAKGELINGEFMQNGQDLIHQHFFIPKNLRPTFDGDNTAVDSDPVSIYKYVYCDTDPWNKNMHNEGATLIGAKNPVGFKGYFMFLKERKNFDISVELMHAVISKFSENGIVSPFYLPSKAQRQRDHWDLKIKVPVTVYAGQMETVDVVPGTSEADIPEKDMRLLKSIASAYGITWQEALEDIDAMVMGDQDPESGNMWF